MNINNLSMGSHWYTTKPREIPLSTKCPVGNPMVTGKHVGKPWIFPSDVPMGWPKTSEFTLGISVAFSTFLLLGVTNIHIALVTRPSFYWSRSRRRPEVVHLQETSNSLEVLAHIWWMPQRRWSRQSFPVGWITATRYSMASPRTFFSGCSRCRTRQPGWAHYTCLTTTSLAACLMPCGIQAGRSRV